MSALQPEQWPDAAQDRRDRLDTLRASCDPARLRPLVDALLERQCGRGATLRSLQTAVLRRRKRRCVLRYTLRIDVAGQERTIGLIGKVFKSGEGAHVAARMQWLGTRGFDPAAADGISIPHLEAYDPDLSLLLQEEIGGRAVRELLPTLEATAAVRRMAQAIAKLHRTPLPAERPWTLQDHLGRCHPAARTLPERLPELRKLLEAILTEAAHRMRAQANVPQALIHGDLHFGQVHVAADRVWLIDLDASCVADPAADLGNALVFLRGKKKRIPHVERLCDAFLDAYFATMPVAILDRVPLYTALTHLRRACKQTRLQDKNWRKRTRRYLEASLACLNEGHGGRGVAARNAGD